MTRIRKAALGALLITIVTAYISGMVLTQLITRRLDADPASVTPLLAGVLVGGQVPLHYLAAWGILAHRARLGLSSLWAAVPVVGTVCALLTTAVGTAL
ncbi:hypothetical protein Lfu02_01620 [Longispora fulva]|uniref:Uncharacterized protein n=1 Tax=Longispora fulva TaxID=619741 RepID=A0A8J7GG22_9ACTN|nr:hypothetical protein [Longispora fulva]MBG6135967.1 hypothetical protein [Longispora fulva]GIG55790.1 hypothetical protein Lfu02_01620 [Longispora fulva]